MQAIIALHKQTFTIKSDKSNLASDSLIELISIGLSITAATFIVHSVGLSEIDIGNLIYTAGRGGCRFNLVFAKISQSIGGLKTQVFSLTLDNLQTWGRREATPTTPPPSHPALDTGTVLDITV